MTQEMDAHVFILVLARHINYHGPTTPLNYVKQKIDLELLDYIAALLLVTYMQMKIGFQRRGRRNQCEYCIYFK